jgi:tetratricopeptide (TPR) repeat protein
VLGQSINVTLGLLEKMNEEAIAIGDEHERVAILMMSSMAYGRLGDQQKAVSMAHESVEAAEVLGDRALLAETYTRLGLAVVVGAPTEAQHPFDEALRLFEEISDVRGQVRSNNHLGLVALFEGRLDDAQRAFSHAVETGRAAGVADVWGLASQNLGVLFQKRGEYDRARALFDEAFDLFVSAKHGEYQMVALYNMAQIDRELGRWSSAESMFETTILLAQRIRHSDIEIGATSGMGLCRLELGDMRRARAALLHVTDLLEERIEWFQGRELAEVLAIRVDLIDGWPDDALRRFERALVLAEDADLYNAAWLAVNCADALMDFAPKNVRSSVERYRTRVKDLGYLEMARRCETLTNA